MAQMPLSQRGVFQFYENRQEDSLMGFVAREEDSGQVIQTVHPVYLVTVQFDLGTWNIFHPCLFDENKPPEGDSRILGGVKIFFHGQALLEEITVSKKPRDSLKILRNRDNGTVRWGIFLPFL